MMGYPFSVPNVESLDLSAYSSIQIGFALFGNDVFDVCQELLQNSLFSPNFFLTLISYGLLSYSVRLYCANIYTPLPFCFLSLRFSDQEDKASRFTLLGGPRTTVLQVLVVIILRT